MIRVMYIVRLFYDPLNLNSIDEILLGGNSCPYFILIGEIKGDLYG